MIAYLAFTDDFPEWPAEKEVGKGGEENQARSRDRSINAQSN